MATNPYRNKIELADGTVLMDLTSDTVTAGSLLSGVTAHDHTGAVITGTLFGVGSLWATTSSSENPATVLGFGTWTKISPGALTWLQLKDTTWNTTGTIAGIYVWQRTA